MIKQIGALWKRKKDNLEYMSGQIEIVAGIKTNIAVFKREKKSDKEPDFNIILSEPKKQTKTTKPEEYF